MGYQESFIQFKDKKTLKKELKKYESRNKENDFAKIVCVDRVKKGITPFRKGELLAVVCGERSEQRNEERLKDGLGVENVKDIVFIDNLEYSLITFEKEMSLRDLLEEHFERLSDEEYQELLK